MKDYIVTAFGTSELIRCKDCKFYWAENHVCVEIGADDGVCHVHVSDDDYCSKAERKEE